MARLLGSIALVPTLAGCAGVSLSNVDDGHSLEYRSAIPAMTVSIDGDCKATAQVVSIPGSPRYMSFRSGLGKADTSVDFGPGGTITKFNSKTEGQVDDALKIASAVMGAAGLVPASDAPTKDSEGPKCKPSVATYLIAYDAAGRPSVDLANPILPKTYDQQ